ncbi:MAG: hypothetical protein AUG85_05455 [Gemmatimonadetes bacterium 13_1_20CM_4_66_11]|nr:MAG: hypothetical protein AUG85_05455 [Gemmatimonadetes bacterium 13_1_20CM_4_66_11]
MWPAWYRKIEPSSGASYIRTQDFHTAVHTHEKRGIAWKFNGEWTTYNPNKSVSYKNLDRLGVDTESDFWTLMDEAQRANIKPPSSLSSIFIEYAQRRHIRWSRFSPKSPFFGTAFGGWERLMFQGGEYAAPIFLYDMNKAYRWSASVGMPDLSTAHRTKSFYAPHAIYLATNIKPFFPFANRNSTVILTSEERDAYGCDSATVLKGVAFRDTIDITPVFEDIDAAFPSVSKRIGQAFWGTWNSHRVVQQVGMLSGKMHELRNLYYNPIWAAFVTGRVKMRCWHWRNITLRVYCDSIMTTEPIPTGSDPGEWKLVREYPSGLRFHGARFTPINTYEGPTPWTKKAKELLPF